MKKYLPNILTSLRIIAVPFIIYLGIKSNWLVLLILGVFVALTDFFDGYFARHFNSTSSFGAKLDTIADKLLAFALLIILIFQHSGYFYIFIMECLIALFNLYVFYKTKMGESLLIGKIKTWVIFITIQLGFLTIIFPSLKILLSIGVVITLILQLLTLIQYISNYNELKAKKKF